MHGNQKSLESIALDVFHAVSISHSSAATNPTTGFFSGRSRMIVCSCKETYTPATALSKITPVYKVCSSFKDERCFSSSNPIRPLSMYGQSPVVYFDQQTIESNLVLIQTYNAQNHTRRRSGESTF